ncbi:MAG: hypothetical protein ABUS51_00285 [Acidobacteriota bacterium]
MRLALMMALLAAMQSPLGGQTRVNADAALTQQFARNVQAYVRLRDSVEEGLPARNAHDKDGMAIDRQRRFAKRLQEVRSTARQGDIFSPEIAGEMRRLIGLGMQGQNDKRVRSSFRSAEPVSLPLKVNSPLPEKLPLQSTPPTLLMNLPRLPSALDYRFAGRTLILRDTGANLIVDFVPEAIAVK